MVFPAIIFDSRRVIPSLYHSWGVLDIQWWKFLLGLLKPMLSKRTKLSGRESTISYLLRPLIIIMVWSFSKHFARSTRILFFSLSPARFGQLFSCPKFSYRITVDLSNVFFKLTYNCLFPSVNCQFQSEDVPPSCAQVKFVSLITYASAAPVPPKPVKSATDYKRFVKVSAKISEL